MLRSQHSTLTTLPRSTQRAGADDGEPGRPRGFDIVYPNGATVSVQEPAVPLISTGSVAYPSHRAVLAAYPGPAAKAEGIKGKLAVLGSVEMLSDAWLDKEGNSRVMEFLFKWMRTGSEVRLDAEDAEAAEISEHTLAPDILKLADRLKAPLVRLSAEGGPCRRCISVGDLHRPQAGCSCLLTGSFLCLHISGPILPLLDAAPPLLSGLLCRATHSISPSLPLSLSTCPSLTGLL